MGTKVYDSNEVTLIVGGFSIDSGRDAGDFVKVTPKDDLFKSGVGADGEVARSKSNDLRADIEIILMATSRSNDVLQGFHTADKTTKGGAGIVPLLLKDNNGGSLISAGKVWVKVLPEVNYGAEAKTRTWKLEASRIDGFVFGSDDV